MSAPSGRMMWRKIMIIWTALGLSATAVFADASSPPPGIPICAYWFAKKYQEEVKTEGTNDKFLHCALSCVLTRVCGPIEAMDLGVLKELVDLFGPGTAEWEDLRADRTGVRIGMLRNVRTRSQCYVACATIYPRNILPE